MALPESIRFKIDRAGDHLKSLQIEVNRVIEYLRVNAIVVDRDPESDEWVWRFVAQSSDVSGVSVLAGDLVHNLRSILDYIVWELADEKKQRPLPEFPIYSQPGQGADGFHQTGILKIWTLPMEAKVIIESLQPYQGGNEPLSVLQRLDNIDKHRRVISVPYAILSTTFLPDARSVNLTGGVSFTPAGRFKYGDVLFRCAGSNPVSQVERVHIQPAYQVAIEEEAVSGEIMAKLTPLYDFVKDNVIPQFEPLFG